MSYVAIAGVVVSAASAGYQGYQSNKANKANKSNQNAYLSALGKSEKEAQKLFDDFLDEYNNSREKLRDGMTLQQYTQRAIQSLNDPQLNAAWERSKNADWDLAQRYAEEGSNQNVSIFKKMLDEVGGGSYDQLVERRNQAILGDDLQANYARARELQAPQQMAGSVRRDRWGNAVEGQAGDRFEFNIAQEQIQQQQERQFARATQAINDDRTAAERQQERALSFLPMLNYSEYASSQVLNPFNAADLQTRLTDLSTTASMVGGFINRAYTEPKQPGMVSTAANDQAMQQGIQSLIGSLGNLSTTSGGSGSGSGGYSTSGTSAATNASSGNQYMAYSAPATSTATYGGK